MNETPSEETTSQRLVKHAADWFFFLVAITLIEVFCGYLGATFLPAFGLVTPLILASGVSGNIPVSLALVALMCVMLLAFTAIGVRAGAGSKVAFTVGLGLYIFDTGLMLATFTSETTAVQRYGGIIWHIVALVAIAQGLLAAGRLETPAGNPAGAGTEPAPAGLPAESSVGTASSVAGDGRVHDDIDGPPGESTVAPRDERDITPAEDSDAEQHAKPEGGNAADEPPSNGRIHEHAAEPMPEMQPFDPATLPRSID